MQASWDADAGSSSPIISNVPLPSSPCDENGQRFLSVEVGSKSVVRSRAWFGSTEFWYADNGNGSDPALQVAGTNYEKVMTSLSLGGLAVARIDNEKGQEKLEYSFHNGLGHLMGALNDNANVSSAFVYGPFGEIIDELGETATHLRRFNGKDADPLSRLNYYGYRYYDPLSLQWTQPDPLFRRVPDLAGANPRDMNLYTFSLNNPVRYVDPDGLEAYQLTTTVDTPDGPRDCAGGRGSTDCEYHKPLYGEENSYQWIMSSKAGSEAADSDNLTLNGTSKQVRAFTDMLNYAATRSYVLEDLLEAIAASGTKPVRIDLTENDPQTYIDSFVTQKVDLQDLQELPRLSATLEHPMLRRGEMIAHFLLERSLLGGGELSVEQRKGMNKPFHDAHDKAFNLQNAVRGERGLPSHSYYRKLSPQIPGGHVYGFSGQNRGKLIIIDSTKLRSAWTESF